MAALLHGPLPLFIAQAVIIILSARLLGLLAKRLNQPMVIAEVTAGILLGPSLLGWLAPDFSAALFPKASLSNLQMLSQVGLIFFMFLIGLELNPRLLKGRGHTSVVISHTSIIVPFILGTGLALYLYPRLSDSSVPFSSFALFMGVAMSITAFPVLARILTERRLMRSKVGAVTITCAAVDDVTAWCVLAFVVCIVGSRGMIDAVQTTVLALAYIAFMVLVVRPFAERLGARGTNRDGLTQNMVALVFVLLLLSAWIAELIGIHALFGAFLLGAIMPKEGGFAQTLTEKIEDLVVVFLLPLFFAFSGLRTQVGLLNTWGAWAMCGLIIAVACIGKFGGSTVAARVTGLSWRESGALGILMNTRGLVELIVLNIGFDLGVISPSLFTMLVIMALVTTFATTPLLELIYPAEELAREVDQPLEIVPARSAPAGFTLLMCVAYDRTGPGMAVLARALTGMPAPENRLYALRLIRPTERASFYLTGQAEQDAAAGLNPLLETAGTLGLQVRPLSFISADPAHDICNIADVKGADLVLLGWHKPLFSQNVLGGTVRDVMSAARTHVAVLIDRGLSKVERILAISSDSPHDAAAVELACRLGRRAEVSLTVLQVIDPERKKGERGADAMLSRSLETVRRSVAQLSLKQVVSADVAEAVLAEAREGYDLVMIGADREWGLEPRPLRLRPDAILKGTPTSLLVVRRYTGEGEARSIGEEGAGSSAPVASKPDQLARAMEA